MLATKPFSQESLMDQCIEFFFFYNFRYLRTWVKWGEQNRHASKQSYAKKSSRKMETVLLSTSVSNQGTPDNCSICICSSKSHRLLPAGKPASKIQLFQYLVSFTSEGNSVAPRDKFPNSSNLCVRVLRKFYVILKIYILKVHKA